MVGIPLCILLCVADTSNALVSYTQENSVSDDDEEGGEWDHEDCLRRICVG